MKRRHFLGAITACTAMPAALAEPLVEVPRFVRPDTATDEGGLWALMDREEIKLRRSPLILQDPALHDYIQDMVCKLAGNHCPDIRVHLVRNRNFNANMAPNGMMQVWSGLMLRMDNEAQLAAVLGHEIGHYLERHSLARLRDAKSRSAAVAVLSVFGLAGAVIGVATAAGGIGYSRDHERRADEIGLQLMSKAGYDPSQASKVWENLLMEAKSDPNSELANSGGMFATHPPIEERKETLSRIATDLPKGQAFESRWLEFTAKYRLEWLNEECKRGKFAESTTLLNRLIERSPEIADYQFARGEIHRLRAQEGDFDIAIKNYQAAQKVGGEPPETYRGLGLIYRERKQTDLARTALNQYLQKAPDAPDALIIKNYLEG